MVNFILTIFWLYVFMMAMRLLVIATGNWGKPTSLGVYVADGLINATIMIWAGFVLWFR